MKIYIDVCCFSRPFDVQTKDIKEETEAVNKIKEEIEKGKFLLVSSYVLMYEVRACPKQEATSCLSAKRMLVCLFQRKWMNKYNKKHKICVKVACIGLTLCILLVPKKAKHNFSSLATSRYKKRKSAVLP